MKDDTFVFFWVMFPFIYINTKMKDYNASIKWGGIYKSLLELFSSIYLAILLNSKLFGTQQIRFLIFFKIFGQLFLTIFSSYLSTCIPAWVVILMDLAFKVVYVCFLLNNKNKWYQKLRVANIELISSMFHLFLSLHSSVLFCFLLLRYIIM